MRNKHNWQLAVAVANPRAQRLENVDVIQFSDKVRLQAASP